MLDIVLCSSNTRFNMLFVAAYVLSVADLRVLSGFICEILSPIPCWVARDIISSPYLILTTPQ
jgi:hypothetical protein